MTICTPLSNVHSHLNVFGSPRWLLDCDLIDIKERRRTPKTLVASRNHKGRISSAEQVPVS
jgi:hypothetical protein